MLWTSFNPVQFASKYGTPTPGFINFLTSKSPWCNTLIRPPQLLVLNLVEVPCGFQDRICFGGMAPDTSSLRAFKDADLGRLAIVVFLSNRSQTITDIHICTIAPTSHLHHCYAIAVVIKNKICHQMVLNSFNVSGQHHTMFKMQKRLFCEVKNKFHEPKPILQDASTSVDSTHVFDYNVWRFCIWTLCYRSARIDQWLSITNIPKPYHEKIHLDSLKFALLVV